MWMYLTPLWVKFGPALGNHLWQSTLFAAAAGLLTLALRKNRARTRYRLWLAASAKFLVPFSPLIALGSLLARTRGAAAPNNGLSFVMEQVGQPFAEPVAPLTTRASATAVSGGALHLLPVLLAMWMFGTLVVLVVWCLRWWRISALIRKAVPMREGREVEALRRAEEMTIPGRRIDMLSSHTSLEPGIFGIARPVLVWPSGISERLEDAHMDAILAHELRHVRRQDNLAATIHMLVEAIFWFHPLVWWVGRQMVEERERACDEEVLESGSKKQVYAESILKICEFCVESPLPCVSGVTGADLKRRIARIMSDQVTRRLDFGRKLLLGAALVGALAMPVVFGVMHTPQSRAAVRGQEAGAASAGTPWELTSFKPTTVPAEKPGEHRMVFIKFMTDGLSGVNLTAHMLIQHAYGVHDNQIVGAPDWVNTDGYDFEAKRNIDMPSGGKPDHDDGPRMQMFQALLSDKFKLAFHRETRSLPVYELVLDPDGSKLADAKPGDPLFRVQAGQMTAQGVPTSHLAEVLSQMLATNVLDNTGLKGKYDFKLTWTPDRSDLPMDAPGWRENAGASLLDGLREQLGLQLKQEITPMEVLVIDHIEKPTAN
jgi:bla regulator protein blaR1